MHCINTIEATKMQEIPIHFNSEVEEAWNCIRFIWDSKRDDRRGAKHWVLEWWRGSLCLVNQRYFMDKVKTSWERLDSLRNRVEKEAFQVLPCICPHSLLSDHCVQSEGAVILRGWMSPSAKMMSVFIPLKKRWPTMAPGTAEIEIAQ